MKRLIERTHTDTQFAQRLTNLGLRVNFTEIADQGDREMTELIAILADQNNDGAINAGDQSFFDGREVQEQLMRLSNTQKVQLVKNLTQLL